jgi:hypothetical protein
MSVKFELPIVFRNHGIPPRHRRARDYTVSDTAVFSIREASPGEVEPALTFRSKHEEDGRLVRHDTVLRQFEGHLVRQVPAGNSYRNGDMTVARLQELGRERPSAVPEALRCKSLKHYYDYHTDTFAMETLAGRPIDSSRREAVVREIQEALDQNLIVDGDVVYSRVHDPKINVSVMDDGVLISTSLIASGRYCFPVDQPRLVDEFTDWLKSEYGLNSSPYRIGSYDRGCEIIFDHEHVPLSANPVVEAALNLGVHAELNVVNAEYFGPTVKELGLAFQAEPTVENALAFAEEFERAVVSGAYPDARSTLDDRDFAIFRKFVELMPDEYKGDLANQYSAEISVPISIPAIRMS